MPNGCSWPVGHIAEQPVCRCAVRPVSCCQRPFVADSVGALHKMTTSWVRRIALAALPSCGASASPAVDRV